MFTVITNFTEAISCLVLDLMTNNFARNTAFKYALQHFYMLGVSLHQTQHLWITITTRSNIRGATGSKIVGSIKSTVTALSKKHGVQMSLKRHHGYRRDHGKSFGTQMILLHFKSGIHETMYRCSSILSLADPQYGNRADWAEGRVVGTGKLIQASLISGLLPAQALGSVRHSLRSLAAPTPHVTSGVGGPSEERSDERPDDPQRSALLYR